MVAPLPKHFRIGIDVGGTNTDAVVINTSVSDKSQCVIAARKTPTSGDITSGIESAVKTVLETSQIPVGDIASITIGTTHFINALIERDTKHIEKVAVLRLSKSFTREVAPFTDFPPDLRRIIECYNAWVDGGLQIDGSPEAPIREDQVDEFCAEVRRRQIRVVAIVGVFSPLDTTLHQERTVQQWIHEKCPGVAAVTSASISNIGLLERENATIINAAILTFARRTITSFRRAIQGLGLSCPMYLTQNDGTLLCAKEAAQCPIRTFNSGPTNSMRGAAYLSGIGVGTESTAPVLVCDIGGTTSDIGILLPSGYPRQTLLGSTVAGVNVNYAMPQVESIGVGGGSVVRFHNGQAKVGDESVGRRIQEEALVFGGTMLTATDIVVASGQHVADFGNSDLLTGIDDELISGGNAFIKRSLERVVDAMKTSPGDLELIMVGGGSIIAPDELKGVSRIIRPNFFDVANAVGAATAKLSVTVDTIASTSGQTTEQAIESVRQTALERLGKAGAIEGTEQVTDVDVLPLQYIDNQVRIFLKIVGDYDSLVPTDTEEADTEYVGSEPTEPDRSSNFPEVLSPDSLPLKGEAEPFEIRKYKPRIVRNAETQIQEWHIGEKDLEWIAAGNYVLGCGGGGDPRPEMLKLKNQLSEGHLLRCISPASLRSDARVYWGGNMGSPSVPAERLSAHESVEAMREIMDYHGNDTMDAVIGLEIGGSNGLLPLSQGSSKVFNVPVIDADWMGRAFPQLWQVSIAVHQPGSLLPVAIASGDGRRLIMTSAPNDRMVDETLRAPCVAMGYYVGLAATPCDGEAVQKWAIKNTMSQAWRIGRCIDVAHSSNTLSTVTEHIIDEVGGPTAAKVLFRGKIVGIERRLHKGHSHGKVVIAHVDDDTSEAGVSGRNTAVACGGVLRVPFMNENLMAVHQEKQDSEDQGNVVATVPDLITVLNAASGKALGIGEYRYGIHVVVLGITCAPIWGETEAGLRDGGPAAFGFDDIEYAPLGTYVPPQSVIEQYGSAVEGAAC